MKISLPDEQVGIRISFCKMLSFLERANRHNMISYQGEHQTLDKRRIRRHICPNEDCYTDTVISKFATLILLSIGRSNSVVSE